MKENKEMIEEIEVDMSDDIFLIIAKQAHEKNITFNEMCAEILKQRITCDEDE